MKSIAITAPTGMLGSMLYNEFRKNFSLVLVLQDEKQLAVLEQAYGGTKEHKVVYFDFPKLLQDYTQGFPEANLGPEATALFNAVGEVDVIINCSSVTKAKGILDPLLAFQINSALPHILGRHYREKLIHISTDCVFSGLDGKPYTEDMQPNPTDIYGFTRSLGEPKDTSLVIRASTVGPEIADFELLVEWVKKQSGKTISGYTRHLWNGLTTKQFAKVLHEIILHRQEYPQNGILHIYSNDQTKFDLLTAIAKHYLVNPKIIPNEIPMLDRRLSSMYELCAKIKIPTFDQMLTDL
jgi:dTDP-4-dehydrorhamnose reductase